MAGIKTFIENPLPALVEDPKQVRELISGLKLLPTFGTLERSAMKYLELFENLYESSGSQGNCINTKAFYAFEGDLEVVKRYYGGLKVPEEMLEFVTYKKQLEFAAFLDETGLGFQDIVSRTKVLSIHEDIYGNAFLRYRQAKVGESRSVSVAIYNCKNCLYLFEDEPTTICIAKEFTREGLEKYGYELVRVYPNWTEHKNYRETLFHLKETSDVYGRPKSINTLNYQLIEWFTSNRMMKISRTDLTALLMFLVKAPDAMTKPEEDETDQVKILSHTLRQLMTNEGEKAKSMSIFEYEGDQPPTVEKLQISRSEKYDLFALNTASSYIHAAHDVPKEISRMVQTNGGIGSNILKDLYYQFDVSVIQPRQMKYEKFWQRIIDLTGEFFGRNDEMGIRFDRTISRMLEAFGSAPQPAQTQPEPQEPIVEPDDQDPENEDL